MVSIWFDFRDIFPSTLSIDGEGKRYELDSLYNPFILFLLGMNTIDLSPSTSNLIVAVKFNIRMTFVS